MFLHKKTNTNNKPIVNLHFSRISINIKMICNKSKMILISQTNDNYRQCVIWRYHNCIKRLKTFVVWVLGMCTKVIQNSSLYKEIVVTRIAPLPKVPINPIRA